MNSHHQSSANSSLESNEEDMNIVALWLRKDPKRWILGGLIGFVAGLISMAVGGGIASYYGLQASFPIKLLGTPIIGASATEFTSSSGIDNGAIPLVEAGRSIGSNKFVVPPRAVLLSKLNPRIPRVWAPDSVFGNAVCSTEFLVLVPNEGVDRRFFSALCGCTIITSKMKLYAIGTTGSHQRISPSQVTSLEISFPESVEEQRSIATILFDMDAEIREIELKQNKAAAVKQGMMQNLLTGKIRLV